MISGTTWQNISIDNWFTCSIDDCFTCKQCGKLMHKSSLVVSADRCHICYKELKSNAEICEMLVRAGVEDRLNLLMRRLYGEGERIRVNQKDIDGLIKNADKVEEEIKIIEDEIQNITNNSNKLKNRYKAIKQAKCKAQKEFEKSKNHNTGGLNLNDFIPDYKTGIYLFTFAEGLTKFEQSKDFRNRWKATEYSTRVINKIKTWPIEINQVNEIESKIINKFKDYRMNSNREWLIGDLFDEISDYIDSLIAAGYDKG